jgi:two-component system, NtrC family, nitrogen regulation sensor histidine kinase NtrY
MGYKHVSLIAVLSSIFSLLLTFAAGFGFSWYQAPGFLLLLVPVPFLIWNIIYNINQSNRQIAFFFEAIRNEDSALKFPTQIKQRSLRNLYQRLNELNETISEIKLKNEYLEKYYQTFIQHASIGLIALNQDHDVDLMNETAFEYAGIPSFVPLHLVPLKNPDLYKVLKSVTPGETVSFKRFTGDSSINLLIRAREIRYGGKRSTIISLQDIRHELDEKELDTWQKLIRILTHEIMNSIAPIVSLTGTMRKIFISGKQSGDNNSYDEETIENLVQGLDTIEERGNGLINFVNSYRKLTRIPRPEFESIDTKTWLEQIRLLMAGSFKQHQIVLDLSIDPMLKSFTGDEKLLTQVMINILNNAREALSTKEGVRKISIDASLTKQQTPLIQITNNGGAIPEDVIEKIFIPFFTTKEEGSGIGLSLSRQILRLHKGSLHVETQPGETSFFISL